MRKFTQQFKFCFLKSLITVIATVMRFIFIKIIINIYTTLKIAL